MGTERTILHSFTPQGVSSEVGITVDPKFPADQVSVARSDDWLGHTGHLGWLLSLASLAYLTHQHFLGSQTNHLLLSPCLMGSTFRESQIKNI